jgi:hypothetical protein
VSGDVTELRDFRRPRRDGDGRDVPPAPLPASALPPGRGAGPREAALPPGRGAPGRTASRRGSSAPATPAPTPTPHDSEHGRDGATGLRRLAAPRPVAVVAGARGVPDRIGRVPVEALLEDWVVEDRWWTGRPVRRRYFELVLVDGRNVVVFRDLIAGRWFAQRA